MYRLRENPIIDNPSVSDAPSNQEQSLKTSKGSATSMLAIVVLGFSSGFDSPHLRRVSDGGTRQEGQLEERIITVPISSLSHSCTSSASKEDSSHPALLLQNEKWAAEECSDRPFAVFTYHLSPFGQEWTLCSLRRPPISVFRAPALCRRWM